MPLLLHRLAAAAVLAFEALACMASVLLLIALALAPYYAAALPFTPLPWQWAAAFLAAAAIAVSGSWVKGIFERRLPGRIGGEPHHRHISGWAFIWIVLIAAGIIALASWAGASDTNRATINTEWGEILILGVAALFILAVVVPRLDLEQHGRAFIAGAGAMVQPLGRALSAVDSVLVFAVAGSAGATQRVLLIRYAMLFGTLGACAYMGYWLEPPWGLVPLGWGFIVAIAISRRWGWIEADRELAMLNRRFTGPHLRIGFEQDLRDEALLSFMSLLVLVPLALRQAQVAATGAHFELFDMSLERAENVRTWFAFFGTELAKAVPFVDWAEVYQVGGGDDSIIRSPASHHFVFAVRILVDLVFLAALLQALAISARNATQRGLFYEGQMDRLDPFLEPKEFRRLLRRENGRLTTDPERVANFPTYDPIRLSELAGEDHNRTMRMVANAVRAAQGGVNIDGFYSELSRRASAETLDSAAILEVIHGIRAAGPERKVAELDLLRQQLNSVPKLIEVRTDLMRLMAEAPDSPEKAAALEGALTERRDNLIPVRVAALTGLADAAARGDRDARTALERAAQSEHVTKREARSIRALLVRLDREGPRAAPVAVGAALGAAEAEPLSPAAVAAFSAPAPSPVRRVLIGAAVAGLAVAAVVALMFWRPSPQPPRHVELTPAEANTPGEINTPVVAALPESVCEAADLTLYFSPSGADPSAADRTRLGAVLQPPERCAVAAVQVIGHADTFGETPVNLALSERRAENVSAAILTHGVAADLVTREAHGESDLALATPDGVSERLNRRVTIHVTFAGAAAPTED